MARFGTFKFGEKKFGAEAVNQRISWAFEVDWNGDGYFDGSNDALKMFNIEIERGRLLWLAKTGGGFEPMMTGKLSVDLLDVERKYDPYNIDSPLYGNLVQGRRFRLRVKRESDGSIIDVMAGRIERVRPNYGDVVSRVKITAVDDSVLLKKKNISSAVYSLKRYDSAIEACLIDAGFSNYAIDTTVSDQMPYWWSSGRSAFAEITSLTDAVLGMFFFAADGTATYKSRLSDDAPVTTLRDSDIQRGILLVDPEDSVRNIVRVYARARRQETNVELWRMTDVVAIPPGESRTVWASFSYNGEDVAALSVTSPVASTDYTANTASDGSGTNITADLSIDLTPFASSAKQVLTNNNVSTMFVTLLKLRGNAIVADRYTFSEERDDDSIAQYNMELELVLKNDWLQDVNSAIDQADILLSRLKVLRPFPRVRLKDSVDKQFLDIFDLVTLSLDRDNIIGDMRVGYIKHRNVNAACDVIETFIHFEPNLTGNIEGTWTFPAVFGYTTIFG